MEPMEASGEFLDHSYFLAAYRTSVTPRLYGNPFSNSTHLLSSSEIFPQQYWHTGVITEGDNLKIRKANVDFCSGILTFARLELDTIGTHLSRTDYDILFNENTKSKLRNFQSQFYAMTTDASNNTANMDYGKLTIAESILSRLLVVFLDLLKSLNNINTTLKSTSVHFERLVYTFYISDTELKLAIERFTTLSADIKSLIHDRLEYVNNLRVPLTREPTLNDSMSLELGIFKDNLDAILTWCGEMATRFIRVPDVYHAMVNKGVPEAVNFRRQTTDGNLLQKIREFKGSYTNPSWLLESHEDVYHNIEWFLALINYLLHYAIDIIYHGMKVFREFADRCSIELQNSMKRVIQWKRTEGKVVNRTNYSQIDVISEFKQFYRLIVRSSFVISKTWNFDTIKSEYKDIVWEEEKELVRATFEKSLDETNNIETRSGIRYRIKRSNIKEAGLGLFFDDDVYNYKDTESMKKFRGDKWGMPLLIYDGVMTKKEDVMMLYGGRDSLRPYSVGTTVDGPELDAYHGNNHDIARFINDSFNRLPEFGVSPDTTNTNVKKRTFSYTVYFLWCMIPKDKGKAKKAMTFGANESAVAYLRSTNDEKLTTGYRPLAEDDTYKYVLAIYTVPLDRLPSSEPEKLFSKGEELWIQYGLEYVRKISNQTTYKNVDYTHQELGSFIFSRRSAIDVSIQEDIEEFFSFETTDSSRDNKETAKTTLERAIVTANILEVRPYNNTDNYYTYALSKISNYFLKELTIEVMKWLDSYSRNELKTPADFLASFMERLLFDTKMIRRNTNGLNNDISMESMISVLTTVCAFYYACILQIIDSNIRIVAELRQDYDIDCIKYINTVSNTAELRITGLESIKRNMERTLELLKTVTISWYTNDDNAFDILKWREMIVYFRHDLDLCIQKLQLSGVSFESYRATQQYIERSGLGDRDMGDVKYILDVVDKMLHAKRARDYIDHIGWLPDSEKEKPDTLRLVDDMFTNETIEFTSNASARLKATIISMKKSKKLKDLVINFNDKTLTKEQISVMDSKEIAGTVLSYALFDSNKNGVVGFPDRNYADLYRLVALIQKKHQAVFFPQWVYDTTSSNTGKKPFVTRFTKEHQREESEMEWSSTKRDIPSGDEAIILDLSLSLNLALGQRYSNDDYPRLGYVLEAFASREFGNDLGLDKIELVCEGGVVKSPQRIVIALTPKMVGEKRTVKSNLATIGVYIKSKVRPFDGRILTEKTKLNYEGELYINLTQPRLCGSNLSILCKTFDFERDYQCIGTVHVNSVSIGSAFEFTGSYDETQVAVLSAMSDEIISSFFDRMLSGEITFHPQEQFLRNKHTPVWPNTPLAKLPSSLYVLNIPIGPSADIGAKVFYKSLEIITSAYGLTIERFTKSMKEILSRPPSYIPNDRDKLELYAVVRIIGEAVALVPDLCDYKPDFTNAGDIGENYGEGVDGIDDCESLGKLCYSILMSVVTASHPLGSSMHYIKEIMLSYVPGLIGCSSSRQASGGLQSDESLREEYRGKMHINHVLGGAIPFKKFFKMCSKTNKYNRSKLNEYYIQRNRNNWFDDYLPMLILEGTGNTVPLMITCDDVIQSGKVKGEYSNWAGNFTESMQQIFRNFPEMTQFAFQDNTPLKFASGRAMHSKSEYSNFYTKFVHFWTGDMAENNGPRVTDFMFCYPRSESPGALSNWVYGVDFYDAVHSSEAVELYPAIEFEEHQYQMLSDVAKKQVYPAYIHTLNENCGLQLIDTYKSKSQGSLRKSVITEYTSNEVSGILSSNKIIAYTNHFELYSEKAKTIRQLVESGVGGIVECKVFRCEMSDITDMVQFVFELS